MAAERFRGAGNVHHGFARGKLRHDPMFAEVLRRGRLGPGGRIVDLGCGRGLLLAAILAARELHGDGAWPDGWHPPPATVELVGVERSATAVRVAGIALGTDAVVEQADLANFVPKACDVAVLFDVLHYLERDAQDRLLARLSRAVGPAGRILIREADRAGGARFVATAVAERLRAIGRGQPGQRFAYRTASEWRATLERHGFAVAVDPLADGTPFANVLISATRSRG
jgi:SAM-dependent methyltransferase